MSAAARHGAAMSPQDQAGRVAIVTGANRGLGLELVKALSARGATVVMACRDVAAGLAQADALQRVNPSAALQVVRLDLADLASVQSFAAAMQARFAQIDLLLHNAAAILVPKALTRDGFEQHIGVNHLGAFALTAGLLPLMQATAGARIVSFGSLAHRLTKGLDFADPHYARSAYAPMDAYGRSKLAAMSFAFELDRRLRAAGMPLRALAAHPGYAATNPDLGGLFMRLSTRLFAQPPAQGALPALQAALAADAEGGDYYGPGGFKELSGRPVKVQARAEARDAALAAQLWAWSEQATGLRIPL